MEVQTVIHKVPDSTFDGEYRAGGHVLRVFDSCMTGLIPVPFQRGSECSRFVLVNKARGQIWAEVVDGFTSFPSA